MGFDFHRIGAKLLSRQADPFHRRLRAGRRDRYLCAADFQRSPGGARPAGGDREQARPGGYIAWTHVASSDPDGYTLLLAENAVAISQALYRNPNRLSIR